MAVNSDDVREAVLRVRLEVAEKFISALAEELYASTGKLVCKSCYRARQTPHCPSCTGLEGVPGG
jgi:hypothetical protein